MTLHIKHMVCDRCIMVVREQLQKAGLHPETVILGEVRFSEDLTADEIGKVKSVLEPLGFGIIDNKKHLTVEKIKQTIIGLVHQDSLTGQFNADELRTNLSDYLAENLGHDYKYLSSTFSDEENVTIEQYFIAQKVERVKELLVYGELTLTEIAYRMNYSSVAYLSAQFKRVTGFTPSEFRKVKGNRRRPIDKI